MSARTTAGIPASERVRSPGGNGPGFRRACPRHPLSRSQISDGPQTHLRDLAACLREVWPARSALFDEGAGNAGRPMRPIAACAMSVVERTRVSQVTPETSGIPHAMVYGLLRALPGDRAFLSPSSAKTCFRQLDASVEASEPHDFAVRKLSALVFSAARVHRILSRVRDDLEPPLCGTGRGGL